MPGPANPHLIAVARLDTAALARTASACPLGTQAQIRLHSSTSVNTRRDSRKSLGKDHALSNDTRRVKGRRDFSDDTSQTATTKVSLRSVRPNEVA
jgi:hypothetical protein